MCLLGGYIAANTHRKLSGKFVTITANVGVRA